MRVRVRVVGTLLIALITSMPSVTLPKTGCLDGVLLSNQSRKALCLVLMKNWLGLGLGLGLGSWLGLGLRLG